MQLMKLWDSVEKTNPEHTKTFKGKGGFKGTAISAQYQIKTATSIWGPMGYKWGLKEDSYTKESVSDNYHHDVLIYKAVFYYPIENETAYFNMETEIDLWNYSKSYSEWSKNNDPRKKARTDLLTKCLSQLGFNADVFMGMFDDNKYVNDLKQEKKQEKNNKENFAILYNLERNIGDREEGREKAYEEYKTVSSEELASSINHFKTLERKRNAINYTNKIFKQQRAKSNIDDKTYKTNTKDDLRELLKSVNKMFGSHEEVTELFTNKVKELENETK